MEVIGPDNKPVSRIKSRRKQPVNVHVGFSELVEITRSVPRGSILGPLLLIIYVNEKAQNVNCDLS